MIFECPICDSQVISLIGKSPSYVWCCRNCGKQWRSHALPTRGILRKNYRCQGIGRGRRVQCAKITQPDYLACKYHRNQPYLTCGTLRTTDGSVLKHGTSFTNGRRFLCHDTHLYLYELELDGGVVVQIKSDKASIAHVADRKRLQEAEQSQKECAQEEVQEVPED